MIATNYGAPEPDDTHDDVDLEQLADERYDAAEQAWEIGRDEG